VIIEKYIDNGKLNIIFHSLIGRKANDALSKAYAYVIANEYKTNVAITLSDNGFILTIPKEVNVDIQKMLRKVKSNNIRELLEKAVEQTEVFRRRFRHCATRALMILRNYKGHEIKVEKQQLNAQVLLEVCKEIEGFPIIQETKREILEDYMNIEGAIEFLKEVERGERRYYILREYDLPSPFAHEMVTIGLSDIVLMEDRKEFLRRLYDEVMERLKCKLNMQE